MLFTLVPVLGHFAKDCTAGFAFGHLPGCRRICFACSGILGQCPSGKQFKYQNKSQKHGKDAECISLFHCYLPSFFLLRIVNSECRMTLCYIRNNAKLTSPFRRQISEFSIYLYHLTTIFYTVILLKVFAQVLYIVAKYSFKENRKITFFFKVIH